MCIYIYIWPCRVTSCHLIEMRLASTSSTEGGEPQSLDAEVRNGWISNAMSGLNHQWWPSDLQEWWLRWQRSDGSRSSGSNLKGVLTGSVGKDTDTGNLWFDLHMWIWATSRQKFSVLQTGLYWLSWIGYTVYVITFLKWEPSKKKHLLSIKRIQQIEVGGWNHRESQKIAEHGVAGLKYAGVNSRGPRIACFQVSLWLYFMCPWFMRRPTSRMLTTQLRTLQRWTGFCSPQGHV